VIDEEEMLKIQRWGWYSIGINVILAGINMIIATLSGSLAVKAEMVHNLVDLLTAIGVLIGLKLSTRKSKEFPYGLYKMENVVTVGLAGMIFFTAYEIARDALFAPAQETTVDVWMLAGLVVATIVPLVFSHFELRAGREANSPALIADAKEYRAHVFTTGVAFAALLGQQLNFPLDRIAALLIVVAIGKTGWDLLVDGMRVLLDASLDADTLIQIRGIIESEPTVAEIKQVTGRNAGRFRFVEAELVLRVRDFDKADRVTHQIERAICEAVPYVERVLIHAEPMERTHLRYAVPLADPDGTLSSHFGEAPYFALVQVRLSDGVVEEQQILRNPHREVEKAKGIRVAEWLVGLKVDRVLLRELVQGKGPAYVFGDAGVEFVETAAMMLPQALAGDEPYWQDSSSSDAQGH
jgi:cation diffusion facilitator family transporter